MDSCVGLGVQLLAPECVVKVDYAATWMAVAVACLAMGDDGKARDQFASRALLVGRVMYVVLCQKALEVVVCVRLSGGKQVLEASPEAVLVWRALGAGVQGAWRR